jgi:hypothetical protein
VNPYVSQAGAFTMKTLFTLSLFNLSPSYLSIFNPSLSKPSVLFFFGQFDY